MSQHRFFMTDINGAVVWDSGLIDGDRVPVPAPAQSPAPTPPAPSGGAMGGGGQPVGYEGPNMFEYEHKRRPVLLTLASPISHGGFTMPAGYAGPPIELLVSGANINMRYDGVLNGGGAFYPTPGPHTFDAELTSGATSAEGSITVQH